MRPGLSCEAIETGRMHVVKRLSQSKYSIVTPAGAKRRAGVQDAIYLLGAIYPGPRVGARYARLPGVTSEFPMSNNFSHSLLQCALSGRAIRVAASDLRAARFTRWSPREGPRRGAGSRTPDDAPHNRPVAVYAMEPASRATTFRVSHHAKIAAVMNMMRL